MKTLYTDLKNNYCVVTMHSAVVTDVIYFNCALIVLKSELNVAENYLDFLENEFEVLKPTYDENAHDKYSPVSTQGLKEAAELSGNWLPWHINKIVRMFQTPQNADLLANVSPSLGLIEDSWDTTFKIFRNIEDEDTDNKLE